MTDFSSIWMTDFSSIWMTDDMSLLHYMDDLFSMKLVLWINAYGVYRNEVKACKDCRRNTWERFGSRKQGRCVWLMDTVGMEIRGGVFGWKHDDGNV